MSLLKLYKTHINNNPDGAEIHQFFTMFNIGIQIKNPNKKTEEIRKEKVALRYKEAENGYLIIVDYDIIAALH